MRGGLRKDKQNTGEVFVRKMGAFLIESSISLREGAYADVLLHEMMAV